MSKKKKKPSVLERANWEYNVVMNTWLVSKDYKQNYSIQFEKWLVDYKELQNKSNRKRTIKRNIKEKGLNWYCTLTLNPEKKGDKTLKQLQASIRKMMSRYDIDYVLIPELTEKGAFHFHGFLRVDDSELIERKIIAGKPIVDRYKNEVYNLVPFEKNYGYTQLVRIDSKNEIERNKLVNYTVKYAVKGEFKTMSSRFPKVRYSTQKAIDFFGADLVKVVK